MPPSQSAIRTQYYQSQSSDLALESAQRGSTNRWQSDLQTLFEHAKERFPDVVWELQTPDGGEVIEEVWGHKAIVYCRAPPSFQARYFSFRPLPLGTSSPTQDTMGGDSMISLSYSLPPPSFPRSLSQSPSLRAASPSPSAYTLPPSSANNGATSTLGSGQILRLPTTIASALFSAELEHLYTAKGMSGEAFDFLFDTSNMSGGAAATEAAESQSASISDEERLERLRHDLVFMWRSKLYSDIRISLTGPFSFGDDGTPNMPDESSKPVLDKDEQQMALFSTHRFILCSRSSYFRSLLLSPHFAPPKTLPLPSTSSSSATSAVDNSPTITLPSPPFTPPSLHFTLGYLYAGTLSFSNRTYDLSTAFAIYRCSVYLSIGPLQAECESRIISEFCHGLFSAHLLLDDFEKLAQSEDLYGSSDWAAAGCTCRTCARRAPRVLTFALAADVKNSVLERGARRALVALFGEAWSSREFLSLPAKTQNGLAKAVAARVVPASVVRHLASVRMLREAAAAQGYVRELEELASVVEKRCNEISASHPEEVFRSRAWLGPLEGIGFSRLDTVDDVFTSITRGLGDNNAAMVYQAIVGDVLLRVSEDTGELVLAGASEVKQKVEEAKMAVVAWLRKRWMGVRFAGGFDQLEGWSLKELSHELDVQVEDLLSPHPAPAPPPPPTITKSRSAAAPRPSVPSTLSRSTADNASDAPSVSSRRPSALPARTSPSSTAAPRSIRAPSIASSTTGSAIPSAVSRSRPARSIASPRPRGGLMNSARMSAVTTSSAVLPPDHVTELPAAASASSVPRALSTATSGPLAGRPKSLASSISSVRSSASTIRKTTGPPTVRGGRVGGTGPRPASGLSTHSEVSSTFQTAMSTGSSEAGSVSRPKKSELPVPSIAPRARKLSNSSTVSVTSLRTGPAPVRPRKLSTASVVTVASASTTKKRPLAASTSTPKVATSGAVRRPASTTSVRSTASTIARKSAPSSSKPAQADKEKSAAELPPPPVPPIPPALQLPPVPLARLIPPPTPRQNSIISQSSDVSSTLSDATASPTKTIMSVASNSTVRRPQADRRASAQSIFAPKRGVTLNVGIPCVITSKRARFRAYARYIGEVEGKPGPWVGVEVRVGDGLADKLDGRDWNDGSLDGVRYFEIGSNGEEEPVEEERIVRRRRLDLLGTHSAAGSVLSLIEGKKREGESLLAEREKRFRSSFSRSASPAFSETSTTATTSEGRGLFVRPEQVILVQHAQEL